MSVWLVGGVLIVGVLHGGWRGLSQLTATLECRRAVKYTGDRTNQEEREDLSNDMPFLSDRLYNRGLSTPTAAAACLIHAARPRPLES